MQLRKKQSGLTFISWLIIFAIGGFFIMLGMKLTPIYLENQSVRGVIESLDKDPLLKKLDKNGIRKIIKRRMKINSIYDFPQDAIKIKKTKSRVKVDITYEREEPIVANIFVVVRFSEQLDTEIIR